MSRYAVIFGFCTLIAGTQETITSRGEHRGPRLIFMSLKHPPPMPASRFSITPLNSRSKWAKNAKNPKITANLDTFPEIFWVVTFFLKGCPPGYPF